MAPHHDASPTATAAHLLTLGLLADTVLLAASRDGPGAFTRGERAALASAGGLDERPGRRAVSASIA